MKQGFEVDENSIYDIQVKSLHEYKRQQMNALYIIHKYLRSKAERSPSDDLILRSKGSTGLCLLQRISFI